MYRNNKSVASFAEPDFLSDLNLFNLSWELSSSLVVLTPDFTTFDGLTFLLTKVGFNFLLV